MEVRYKDVRALTTILLLKFKSQESEMLSMYPKYGSKFNKTKKRFTNVVSEANKECNAILGSLTVFVISPTWELSTVRIS